jgi:hypothetical protein
VHALTNASCKPPQVSAHTCGRRVPAGRRVPLLRLPRPLRPRPGGTQLHPAPPAQQRCLPGHSPAHLLLLLSWLRCWTANVCVDSYIQPKPQSHSSRCESRYFQAGSCLGIKGVHLLRRTRCAWSNVHCSCCAKQCSAGGCGAWLVAAAACLGAAECPGSSHTYRTCQRLEMLVYECAWCSRMAIVGGQVPPWQAPMHDNCAAGSAGPKYLLCTRAAAAVATKP